MLSCCGKVGGAQLYHPFGCSHAGIPTPAVNDLTASVLSLRRQVRLTAAALGASDPAVPCPAREGQQ